MGFLYPMPPCGMQDAGGSKNRQELVYPNGKMFWPDLHEELNMAVCVEGDKIFRDGHYVEDLVERRLCNEEISSDFGEKNGFVITGEEKFLIKDCKFSMSGDGRNDFNCIGTAVTADTDSNLTLKDCFIETKGLVRSCTAATYSATLRVYNSTLISHGGTLPEGFDPKPGPGGMLTPPPGLEIGGTARTHLSMKHSRTYFYDSDIEADGWAALSTDASDDFVYLEANRCNIKVNSPGYGVYSDGGCHVVLNDCKVDVATHVGIMAGECTGIFENLTARSGKYFLMVHNVMGIPEEAAEVTVRGGDIETGKECLRLRSCNTYIEMMGTKLKSKEGILVHALVSDDMCATKTEGKAVFGNNIVFSDMTVSGDLINDDTDRVLTLTMSATDLKGALKDVYLKMDSSSKWTADKDSSVVIYSLKEFMLTKGLIDAIEGVTIKVFYGEERKGKEYTTLSGGHVVFM